MIYIAQMSFREIIIAGPTSRMTKMTIRRLRSAPGPMSCDFEDEIVERWVEARSAAVSSLEILTCVLDMLMLLSDFPQFGLFWEADAVARSIRGEYRFRGQHSSGGRKS